jgi:hypothetical protein
MSPPWRSTMRSQSASPMPVTSFRPGMDGLPAPPSAAS